MTKETQRVGRLALTPAVVLLFVWMIVPLAMTIYFSTLHYSLLNPGTEAFIGFDNYYYFLTDPAFLYSMRNTLLLVGSVLAITIVLGTLIAILLDQAVVGRSIVRLMVIAPFFIMPTVSALVWKNLLMHPVSGLFAFMATSLGLTPIDWFADAPLLAIILIVAWQWLPFATLILLTALQSLDEEQQEAAEMDGAGAVSVLLLHHAAAPRPPDHRRHPHRDDLSAHRLRRDIRHHRRRPGSGDDQYRLPDLPAGADPVRRRHRFRRRPGRRGDRQHRRLLPRPHRRPQPGCLRTMARRVSTTHKLVTTVAAWIVGFVIFFPILWMVLASFKTELEAFAIPPSFLFFHWTTENYAAVQERSDYLHHAINSIVIAGGSTLIALLIAIPAAWSMAFAPTKRTRDILLWMLSTKMMPPVGVLVPIYLLYRTFGLLDSRAGLIMVLCLGNLPIVVWMLFTYFKEIPKDILEAARMDGATVGRELIYVLTPMALPGIASTLLLNVILAWNEAFWTLNLSTSAAAPLTVFIASYSSPEGLFWAKLSAASTLAIAPILVLGWFSQRQLVRGLTFGAVK